MVVQVSTEADVQLVAYDNNPIVDLNIYPFCKNLNYNVFLECETTGSGSLQWKSSFFEHTFIISSNTCHPITSGNIVFILITEEHENNMTSSFTSQLQLPTSVLREQMETTDKTQLEVTCHANTNIKRMVLIAEVPGRL